MVLKRICSANIRGFLLGRNFLLSEVGIEGQYYSTVYDTSCTDYVILCNSSELSNSPEEEVGSYNIHEL